MTGFLLVAAVVLVFILIISFYAVHHDRKEAEKRGLKKEVHFISGFNAMYTDYKPDARGARKQLPACRIDFPHYATEDESMCSVCGARFTEKTLNCPHCGVRFTDVRKDESEWEEEFDEDCDLDEEEGG